MMLRSTILIKEEESSESQMEERKFWNSQLGEIEGLQFRQETGTHLASLVVEEEDII